MTLFNTWVQFVLLVGVVSLHRNWVLCSPSNPASLVPNNCFLPFFKVGVKMCTNRCLETSWCQHIVYRHDILWCCLQRSECPKSTGGVSAVVVIDRNRLVKTGGCKAVDCPSDTIGRCVVTRGRTLCVPFSSPVKLSSQQLFVKKRRECCQGHTGYTYNMEFDVCYKMYTHCKRFTEGRGVCKKHNGNLAMPKTVELQAFYVDHVLSKSSVNAFLGAMCILGQWRWLDKSLVKGIRFKRPGFVPRLCLQYNRDENALTNDKCKHSYTLGFLCEVPMKRKCRVERM